MWGESEGEGEADTLLSREPDKGLHPRTLTSRRGAEGEAGSLLSREPSAGLDPKTPGS